MAIKEASVDLKVQASMNQDQEAPIGPLADLCEKAGLQHIGVSRLFTPGDLLLYVDFAKKQHKVVVHAYNTKTNALVSKARDLVINSDLPEDHDFFLHDDVLEVDASLMRSSRTRTERQLAQVLAKCYLDKMG